MHYLTHFRVRLALKQLSAPTYFEHWVNGQENEYTELIIKKPCHPTTYSFTELYLSIFIYIYIHTHTKYTHTHSPINKTTNDDD